MKTKFQNFNQGLVKWLANGKLKVNSVKTMHKTAYLKNPVALSNVRGEVLKTVGGLFFSCFQKEGGGLKREVGGGVKGERGVKRERAAKYRNYCNL